MIVYFRLLRANGSKEKQIMKWNYEITNVNLFAQSDKFFTESWKHLYFQTPTQLLTYIRTDSSYLNMPVLSSLIIMILSRRYSQGLPVQNLDSRL